MAGPGEFDAAPARIQREIGRLVSGADGLARRAQTALLRSLGQFASTDPSRPTFVGLDNRVKTRFSLARKIRELVQNGWTITRAVWAQDDLVRFSIQVSPDGYAETVRKVLNGLVAAGWSVPPEPAVGGPEHPDWRNAWVPGNRFHGLAVIVTDPASGDRVEVQFPTPQSWVVGGQTHSLYETFRDADSEVVDRVRALARIIDIASGTDIPQGAELLGPSKPNGPEEVFAKSPKLAVDFFAELSMESLTPLQVLVQMGVTATTAARVVEAAEAAAAAATGSLSHQDAAHIDAAPQAIPADQQIVAAGFTPGQTTLAALDQVLPFAQAEILWRGTDSTDNEAILRLPDGSAIELTLGRTPWSLDEVGRPLQSWAVDQVQLDDGPLTPAAARFLAELRTVASLPPGPYEMPLQQWVMQRATLNPATHEIDSPGVAKPLTPAGKWMVWDAAQGWVPSAQLGGVARVRADSFVTVENLGDHEAGHSTAGEVVARATALLSVMGQDPAQVAASAVHDATVALARATIRPGLSAVLQAPAEVLGEGFGHVVLEHPGGVAVVAVSSGETAALPGSRPGLAQVGTTAGLGRLRNRFAAVAESERELSEQHADDGDETSAAQHQARYEYHHNVAVRLTDALRNETVRQFRASPVVTNHTFVGARVTEFVVDRAQPAHPGQPRAAGQPHRYGDAGFEARRRMAESTAGWAPASDAERIAGALERLHLINPNFAAFRDGARNAVPWGDNCGSCSTAFPDLLQGRTPWVADGDNGARLSIGWPTFLTPGERHEVYDWAGTSQPQGLRAPGAQPEVGAPIGSNQKPFTKRAYRAAARALADLPVGSVAIIGVGWHNPATTATTPKEKQEGADERTAADGGHWFNAVVTDEGLLWVDAQMARYGPWPPPYSRQIWELEGIVQLPGSDTWEGIDLSSTGGWTAGGFVKALPFFSGTDSSDIIRAQDSGARDDLLGGPATASSMDGPSPASAEPGAGRSRRGSFVPRPVDLERVAAHAGLEGPGYSAQGSISFSFPPEQVTLTAELDAQHYASARARSLATKVRDAFIQLSTEQLGDEPPSRRIIKQMAGQMPRAAGALTTSRGEVFTHTSLRGSAPDRIHPVVAAAYEFAEVDLGEGMAKWHGQCVEVALFSDALHAAEARGDRPASLPPAGAPREDWSAALTWANAILDGAVLDVVGTNLPASVDELVQPKEIQTKEPCESCRWVLGRELEHDLRDYEPVRNGLVVPRLMLDTVLPMQLPTDPGKPPVESASSGRRPPTGDGELAREEPDRRRRGLGPTGLGLLSLTAADAAFAARLSNPSGDWPEDDDGSTGVSAASSTEAATVSVESPHGERRSISVAWVDGGRGSVPVLVLREIPGQQFWWSVPEAVLQAVERARQALDPDPARWARAVVMGCISTQGPGSGVTQYPVDLTRGQASRSSGVPRELPVDEAHRALAYVGLR